MRRRKKYPLYSTRWISQYAQHVVEHTAPVVEDLYPILSSEHQPKTLEMSITWLFRCFVLQLLHHNQMLQGHVDTSVLSSKRDITPDSVPTLCHLIRQVSQLLYMGSEEVGAHPHDFWVQTPLDTLGCDRQNGSLHEALCNLVNATLFFQGDAIDFTRLPLETLGAIHEHLLQRRLEGNRFVTINQRKKSGTHFTPMTVSTQLVQQSFDLHVLDNPTMNWQDLRICDPAMGCGAFLLATLRVLSSKVSDQGGLTEQQRKQYVVEHILHGVDIHPRAVQIAIVTLWLEIGDIVLSTKDWGRQFRVGNSLVGYTPKELGEDGFEGYSPQVVADAMRYRFQTYCDGADLTDSKQKKLWETYTKTQKQILDGAVAVPTKTIDKWAFHWTVEFSSIFEQGGFDWVIGNPPFVNAIRSHIPAWEKAFYRHRFTMVQGAADLAYYFVELSTHLIKPTGLISFVLPKVTLGAAAMETVRQNWTARSIHFPSKGSLFADANVQIVLLILSAVGTTRIANTAQPASTDWKLVEAKYKFQWAHLTDNWWTTFWFAIRDIPAFDASTCIPLRETDFEVASGLITNEFYEVKIEESESGTNLKLLTSGGIDAETHFWGMHHQKFRKHSYLHPRLLEEGMSASIQRKFKRSRRPKIIIANQTKHVEAYLDTLGEFQASTATSEIYHKEDSVSTLKRMLQWLHSDSMAQLYPACLGFNALGEGISMSKDFLLMMPVPSDVLIGVDQNLKK